MSNEDIKKNRIDWPEWKNEDGTPNTDVSVWGGEWYVDPGEPVENLHVKMTYKEDKIYMFMYTDIKRRLDENTLRTYIDEITGEVQSDEDYEELVTFFQHWMRTCEQEAGGREWDLEVENDDGYRDYHLPFNPETDDPYWNKE